MHKLKLESLQIESFETTAAAPDARLGPLLPDPP